MIPSSISMFMRRAGKDTLVGAFEEAYGVEKEISR
jgi:hypothetical protein